MKGIKLTTTLTLCLIGFYTLFLAPVSYLSVRIFEDVTFEEISKARVTQLNANVGNVSGFISDIQDEALLFVSNEQLIQYLSRYPETPYDGIVQSRYIGSLVTQLLQFKRNIQSIEIYTSHYNQNLPLPPDSVIQPLEKLTSEPWAQKIVNADGIWLPVKELSEANTGYLSYVHPILNVRSEAIGYVKFNISVSKFKELIDPDVRAELQGSLLIVDSGGQVMASIYTEDGAMGKLDGISLQRDTADWLRNPDHFWSSGYERAAQQSESALWLYSRPGKIQWRLIQYIPTDVLRQKMPHLGRDIALIGLASLLLSIPLAYFVARGIIGPVRSIIQGMRKVQEGQFDVRMRNYAIDEFTQLSSSFNHMVLRLQDLIRSLDAEHRAKRRAEVQVLQDQIKPHFLYNTLDFIHWQAMDHGARDISKMVQRLGRMFQIGLSKGRPFITLRNELEHVNCYIEIQKARIEMDFAYREEVPLHLKNCFVPKIILQPFIENCFIHAYRKTVSSDKKLMIQVIVSEDSQRHALHIRIQDNGIGLEPSAHKQDRGIGIDNVKERIQLYCGYPYGLTVSNAAEGGVVVDITLPVIQNEDELNQCLEGKRDD